MADTCNIRIFGLLLAVVGVGGGPGCGRVPGYGAPEEVRPWVGIQPPATPAPAPPPAATPGPVLPAALTPTHAPRPARPVSPTRPARWGRQQLHGQRCRLPPDSFSRPVGLYFADRHARRRVALTFDDGPLYRRTDRILDLLQKSRLKATFFVVGSMIHGSTFRTVQRIVREGHILANHSFHHRTRLASQRQARALYRVELLLTQAMVDVALLARSRRQFNQLRRRLLGGVKRSRFPGAMLRMWPVVAANWRAILREHGRRDGRSPYPMRYARPPGGNPLMGRWTRAQRRDYAAAVQGLGLVTVLWNSASADSTPGLSAFARQDGFRVSASVLRGAWRGGVLLMHDWMNSAHLAPALVALSGSRSVRVVSLHQLVRRKLGCDAARLGVRLRARETAYVQREQRARKARRARQSRPVPGPSLRVGTLRPVATPPSAPPPPPSRG